MIPRPRLRLRSPVGADRHLRNERGAVLALMVLMLIVLLGLAALAIDLGLVFVARGEAQRTADAAAHAGAVHLSRAPADDPGARAAAVAVALANPVRGVPAVVDPIEDIDVLLDSAKVRVRVHRTQTDNGGIRTLFAQVLGFGLVDVSTVAAAEVWTASQAQCVLPVALPDRWCEDGDGTNCNRYPDYTDDWDPVNDGDYYVPWVQNPTADPEDWVYNSNHTGYSDANRGDPITLRPGPTGGGGGQGGVTRWNPSWWNAFRTPGTQGTPDFAERVRGCVEGDPPLGYGDSVSTEPGNFGNPVKTAFDALIGQDPTAVWNSTANGGDGCVTSSGSSECRDSPRIRPMVMFNPENGPDNGHAHFELSNLVAVFVEATAGSGGNVQVTARFVEYTGAIPSSRGAGSGSLLKVLRIVE
jgi:hypothetical protein